MPLLLFLLRQIDHSILPSTIVHSTRKVGHWWAMFHVAFVKPKKAFCGQVIRLFRLK